METSGSHDKKNQKKRLIDKLLHDKEKGGIVGIGPAHLASDSEKEKRESNGK